MKNFFIAMAAILILTGCSPVKMPPVSSYMLTNLPLAKTKQNIKSNATLFLSHPNASSGYETDAMLYMQIPYELKPFAKHRWVAPPAQMLLPIIAEAIRETGYFYAIQASPFNGNATYRLDTQLLAFQQEFLKPVSQIRMIIQVVLINNSDNKIIASQLFSILVPAPSNSPYSGVLAANKAAKKLSKKVAFFVLKNVKGRGVLPSVD